MGAIKLTADGLILVGKIMKADGVEEYVKSTAKDLLAIYAPETLKHLRPESRAINSLIKDVEAAMEDENLRKLVQKTSERYPSVIGQIATRGDGIETAPGTVSLRLVPRYLVNGEALREITKKLDGVARLEKLKGGREARAVFFDQLTGQIDALYTTKKVSVSKPLQVRDREFVVHYDSDFDWKPKASEPKYMGAYYLYWGDEKELKKNRGRVQEQLDEFVNKMTALTPDEIDKLRVKIKPPTSYSF